MVYIYIYIYVCVHDIRFNFAREDDEKVHV